MTHNLKVVVSNTTGPTKLSYAEYIRLCEERDRIVRKLNYENVKLDIWDQAREICLNIADEMEEPK